MGRQNKVPCLEQKTPHSGCFFLWQSIAIIEGMYRVICVLVIVGFFLAPAISYGETDAERKARLEKELHAIETQILGQQRLVEQKQEERQSLERDLDIIDAQISKAQLGIQARAVAIEQLTDQIGDKEVVLEILD